jgi:hypothetical protein
VNTLSPTVQAQASGTYYYVGVTPTGGVEVRSATATQMPYAAASAVVLGALDPGTNGFSATWNVSTTCVPT